MIRHKQFEEQVEEVIAQLPKRFRNAIRNLSIIVEDEPNPVLLSELGHDPDELLLGLYIGTPLPERTYGEESALPDQILIFRRPIERVCRSKKELQKQIKITVLHELAHYFGFDDPYLLQLGFD